MSSNGKIKDYDDIPVKFCKHCLFLGNTRKTKFLDSIIEYCPQCGSTEFDESLIDEWNILFEKKYKQGNFLKLNKPWRKIMEESR